MLHFDRAFINNLDGVARIALGIDSDISVNAALNSRRRVNRNIKVRTGIDIIRNIKVKHDPFAAKSNSKK